MPALSPDGATQLDASGICQARAHQQETGHPIIKSYQPGKAWGWCYVDEAWL